MRIVIPHIVFEVIDSASKCAGWVGLQGRDFFPQTIRLSSGGSVEDSHGNTNETIRVRLGMPGNYISALVEKTKSGMFAKYKCLELKVVYTRRGEDRKVLELKGEALGQILERQSFPGCDCDKDFPEAVRVRDEWRESHPAIDLSRRKRSTPTLR